MKLLILIALGLFSSFQISEQEEIKMYCFASVTDINGLTIMSEIHEVSAISAPNKFTSFKIVNTTSFIKVIGYMGHKLAYNNKTSGVSNLITISNDWEEINRLYDEIKSLSNGKLIVIDRERFSILSANRKEVLIRE